MVSALIRNRPVASTLQWHGTSKVVFHLIDKVNNKILAREPSFAWKQSFNLFFLDLLNQTKNILPSSLIKIWDKSVNGFNGYDRTHTNKQPTRNIWYKKCELKLQQMISYIFDRLQGRSIQLNTHLRHSSIFTQSMLMR